VHSIAVAGHICLDVTPLLADKARIDPGALIEVGPLSISLGGAVANTGTALTNLGIKTVPYGTVGDDELGRLLLAKLSQEGFRDPHLAVSEKLATSYSLVVEHSGTDRTFWHHTGANAEFDGASVSANGHGVLHVGYPPLLPGLLENSGSPLQELFTRARAEGVTTSLDLAVVDPQSAVGKLDWEAIYSSVFPHSDIVTPSLDDLTSALRIEEPYSPALVQRLADQLIVDGVAIAVISAGEHGLYLKTASAERLRSGGKVLEPLAEMWADRTLMIAPLPVPHPVTTTGTGDASTAGLLYGLCAGATPEQALSLSVACSAAVMDGSGVTVNNVLRHDATLASVLDNQQ
jgi:sugar/nucleoside kinase (ribokinase family)